MNQYLLAVHTYPADAPAEMPDPADMQAAFDAVARFNEKIVADGSWVFGGGLHPPATATVVDNRTGDLLITDGPYAETKEHLGGFWVIKAPDLDAALKLAAEASAACQQAVEVRPFQEDSDELPERQG